MSSLVDQIEILENEIIYIIDEVDGYQSGIFEPPTKRTRRLNSLRIQLEILKKLFDERYGNNSPYLT
jgi:hypothetical protein